MPRRNLFNKLSDVKTLEHAWTKLNKSNRRSQGLSNETIDSFENNLKENLQQLSRELKSGKFKFSLLRGVAIDKTKPSDTQKKYRAIKIAEIKDRVVLKALAIVLENKLKNKFKLDNAVSFGYRENIGVAEAITRMVAIYKTGRTCILEADIKKFFDSVDNEKLLNEKIFPALGKDTSINQLLLEGLSQEIGNANELTELELLEFKSTKGGIPQGSALSPLLSNICLADFDQRMITEGFGLVRYADDFIVLCKDETEAGRAYLIALEEISKLNLELYPLGESNSKTKISRPAHQIFSFLSIRFDGNVLWPTAEKVEELKEKIKYVTDTSEFPDVLTVLKKTNNLLAGWLSAFHYCDVDRYFKVIDDEVDYQLFNALRQFNWELKLPGKTRFKRKVQVKSALGSEQHANCLSLSQRRKSGIILASEFFSDPNKSRYVIEFSKVRPFDVEKLIPKPKARVKKKLEPVF